MVRPTLIIMSGPPAAGKTTSAPLLARALGIPLFSIDEIKERLADAIGPDALAYADKLGKAAIHQSIAIAHELLTAGEDVMIEGYLQHGPNEPLLAPLLQHAHAVLIHVRAADLSLKDRYETRAMLPDRHWVHGDIARIGTLLPELPAEMAAPLELGISRIFIDTTSGPMPVNDVVTLVNAVLQEPVPRDYAVTMPTFA